MRYRLYTQWSTRHVCVVVVDEDDDDIRKVSCWGSAGSGELGISATEFPMTYSTIPQIVPSISNASDEEIVESFSSSSS